MHSCTRAFTCLQCCVLRGVYWLATTLLHSTALHPLVLVYCFGKAGKANYTCNSIAVRRRIDGFFMYKQQQWVSHRPTTTWHSISLSCKWASLIPPLPRRGSFAAP